MEITDQVVKLAETKPVLIHIPETMHKDLRRLALEDGIPLTQITERLLREFLVKKGYTQHAAK